MLKYYKVCYYDGDNLLGGQFIEPDQLKYVKYYVAPYLRLFKIITIRIELNYPEPMKVNIELQKIEVF